MPVHPLLIGTLPKLAHELENLLAEQGESELAAQIRDLSIFDRCRCGDDFCATFYTQPKPEGSYGSNHRCVELTPIKGMLILDIVDDRIMKVEVLFKDEIRDQVHAILP
jgi:hypothetical protein